MIDIPEYILINNYTLIITRVLWTRNGIYTSTLLTTCITLFNARAQRNYVHK